MIIALYFLSALRNTQGSESPPESSPRAGEALSYNEQYGQCNGRGRKMTDDKAKEAYRGLP